MMPGSTPRFTGRHGVLLVLVTIFVVLALALVAPVDGQSGSREHNLQLVHPILPHTHWAGDRRGDLDNDDGDIAAPIAGPDLTIAPAGSFGAWPALTTEGLLLPAFSAMLGLWFALRIGSHQVMLADQTWLAVPTGPPR